MNVIRLVIDNSYGLALFDGSHMLDTQKLSEHVVKMQAYPPPWISHCKGRVQIVFVIVQPREDRLSMACPVQAI